MSRFRTIFTREYLAYFNSPIAYIFSIAFLLITSGLYMVNFFIRDMAEMKSFFSTLAYMLILFIPALTMRIWTEERRQGTLAMLQVLPVTTAELVSGKFAAAFLFFLTVLAGTLPLVGVVTWFGEPDYGQIISGYIGAALLGGLFLAAGMWAGTFLSDQIAAFILGAFLSFGIFMAGTEEVARFLDGWVGGLGAFFRLGLGAAAHYRPFLRGMLPLGDIIYFLGFICALLVLNVYVLSYPLRLVKNSYASLISFLIMGAAVFVSAWAGEAGLYRLDITSQGKYSLSPVSREILSEVPYPLDITYFVSPPEAMPSRLKNLEEEVRDRLEEFAKSSDKVRLHINRIDSTDSEDAAELARRGVTPFTVRTVSRDSFQVTKIYSAITTTYLDRMQQAVSQVTPENLNQIEYWLISSVLCIQREKAPNVSLYASLDRPDKKYMAPGVQKAFMRFGSKMPRPVDRFDRLAATIKEEGFRFDRISLIGKLPIPEETDCLVVVAPEDFTPLQAEAVKNFLAKGKSVALALQNSTYEYRPGGSGGLYVKSRAWNHGLNGLLEEIGVPLSQKVLMDKAQQTVHLTRRLDAQGKAGDKVRMPVKLPTQILVTGDQIREDIPFTEGVSKIFAMWGTAIKPDEKRLLANGLTAKVVFTSGPASWEAEAGTGRLDAEYFKTPEKQSPRLPLGVLVEGDFSRLGKETPHDATKKSPEKGRLLLLGSSEMFKNGILGQGENRLFLMNALDTLTLGGRLLPLRTKIKGVRYLRESPAKEKLAARFLGIALVPFIVAVAGTGHFVWCGRRRGAYLKAYRSGDRITGGGTR